MSYEKTYHTGCAVPSAIMLVFVVFLTLKLAGVGLVADWSWWWVTCPLWIVPALFVAMIAIVLTVVFVATILGIG